MSRSQASIEFLAYLLSIVLIAGCAIAFVGRISFPDIEGKARAEGAALVLESAAVRGIPFEVRIAGAASGGRIFKGNSSAGLRGNASAGGGLYYSPYRRAG